MKVAILHYWLVSMRGGEKVVEALCEMFPDAVIFTHVYDPEAVSETIRRHRVVTSFIQKLPAPTRLYKKYLFLMPVALDLLDLQDYDLVISSEAGPMKGAVTRPDAVHLCYCHSPMRYIWDQFHTYRRNARWLTRVIMNLFVTRLRLWDTVTASRADEIVANSTFVAARIQKYYGRTAAVIHPPVAVDDFAPSDVVEDFYLCFGQLVGYKRVDIAVDAFNISGRRLVIAGTGEAEPALRRVAKPNVTFLGRTNDALARRLLGRCRALVFPGVEDFGLVPIEAMASGRPVIAYGVGGALETVVEGRTGTFFYTQTAAALNEAVDRYESMTFHQDELRAHARRFDKPIFQAAIRLRIERLLAARRLPAAVTAPLRPCA